MNHKPLPLFPGPARARCPHCGQTSYSAGGIHPQCSVRAADQDWTKQMKLRREAVEVFAPHVIKPFQRLCPKCQSIQHARTRKCTCGHVFPIKTRATAEN
ncbi:hypothetical protein [Planctomicrobium piriforme]|uniref:Uncharacterized protein n=1 Tax=Planctomicrobium piriforme TaxID=1576369 RepID=A0A1I3IP45_9PLAN|nr:hypothetical protein [Planctomicrobium piriforme]SFI49650.1 hypothetical protein SAMN05421753_109199 [Planctomicrobium piriforme]